MEKLLRYAALCALLSMTGLARCVKRVGVGLVIFVVFFASMARILLFRQAHDQVARSMAAIAGLLAGGAGVRHTDAVSAGIRPTVGRGLGDIGTASAQRAARSGAHP